MRRRRLGKYRVGIDETNYSPSAAGDCVVVACALLRTPPAGLLRDSKQTSLKQRLRALEWLQWNSVYVVEIASVNHIAAVGISEARAAAMHRAAAGLWYLLKGSVSEFIVDGLPVQSLVSALGGRVRFVVEADTKVPEVQAASILAKLYTDALFEGWGKWWPYYGLERDHGALSDQHRKALRDQGPCPLHRIANYGPNWWRALGVEPLPRLLDSG